MIASLSLVSWLVKPFIYSTGMSALSFVRSSHLSSLACHSSAVMLQCALVHPNSVLSFSSILCRVVLGRPCFRFPTPPSWSPFEGGIAMVITLFVRALTFLYRNKPKRFITNLEFFMSLFVSLFISNYISCCISIYKFLVFTCLY